MRSTTDTAPAPGPERQAAVRSSSRIGRSARLAVACALAALFVLSIGKYYHPGTGFTALIGLPAGHDYEAPAMRAVPHYDYAAAGAYDGQFYAQRALDPLARDPSTDRAM